VSLCVETAALKVNLGAGLYEVLKVSRLNNEWFEEFTGLDFGPQDVL